MVRPSLRNLFRIPAIRHALCFVHLILTWLRLGYEVLVGLLDILLLGVRPARQRFYMVA